jgi:hypothetical protein
VTIAKDSRRQRLATSKAQRRGLTAKKNTIFLNKKQK